jgi:hypothetical protein
MKVFANSDRNQHTVFEGGSEETWDNLLTRLQEAVQVGKDTLCKQAFEFQQLKSTPKHELQHHGEILKRLQQHEAELRGYVRDLDLGYVIRMTAAMLVWETEVVLATLEFHTYRKAVSKKRQEKDQARADILVKLCKELKVQPWDCEGWMAARLSKLLEN